MTTMTFKLPKLPTLKLPPLKLPTLLTTCLPCSAVNIILIILVVIVVIIIIILLQKDKNIFESFACDKKNILDTILPNSIDEQSTLDKLASSDESATSDVTPIVEQPNVAPIVEQPNVAPIVEQPNVSELSRVVEQPIVGESTINSCNVLENSNDQYAIYEPINNAPSALPIQVVPSPTPPASDPSPTPPASDPSPPPAVPSVKIYNFNTFNCGWSIKFQEEWDKFTDVVSNDTNINSFVKAIDVKCDKECNQSLCAEYHVKGYPTVIFNVNGQRTMYEGDRTVDGLKSVLNEHISKLSV